MRRSMHIGLILAISLLVVTVALSSCTTSQSTPTEKTAAPAAAKSEPASGPTAPVKIGVNLGLTGFMAPETPGAWQGVRTRVEQEGSQILGRKIELILEDNASDPVMAVDRARKMVERDKVDVMIGPIFSPSFYAVADYLLKSGTGIPHISMYGMGNSMFERGAKAFVPQGQHSMQGYLLAQYAHKELGYKKASYIYLEDDTGKVIGDGIARALKEAGGSLIQTQVAPADTQDFSSYLLNMKKVDADAVFIWIFGHGIGPFLKQYHEAGLKMPLVWPMVATFPEPIMAEVGDLSLNIIGSEHYVPLIESEINKKFVDDIVKAWKQQPLMAHFGGYLATSFFLEGMKATGGDTSPTAVSSAMAKLKLDSASGMWSFRPYMNSYIGVGDFYIVKSVKIGDRYAWQPIKKHSQVFFDNKE